MVMTIWDAVDHYYALNVSWPYNEGNPKDLVEFVLKVKPALIEIKGFKSKISKFS